MSARMSGWLLFPHFIVRTTGFPWELLERLRCQGASEVARRWLQAEADLQRLRVEAPRLRSPSRAVLAALKAGRVVPAEHMEDPSLFSAWNQAAAAAQRTQEEFERTFEAESEAAKAALREIAADPRFLEAVASSSPPVHGDLQKGRWSARMERQLAGYIQRLCAKNETMSFFGPINYGRCEPEGPDGVELSWSGPSSLPERRTHLASWLIQGVAHRIAFDPGVAPWLVLRLKGFADPPLSRRRQRLGEILMARGTLTRAQLERTLARQEQARRRLGELLVEAGLCTGGEVEEALAFQAKAKPGDPSAAPADEGGDLLVRLVRAVDGARNLAALSEELAAPLPALIDAARTACERRLLTHPLELPSASPRPLAELIERLSGVPGPAARKHLAALAELRGHMARYSAADAATKVRLNEELREQVERIWQVHPAVAEKPREESAGEGEIPAEQRKTQAHFYVDRLPMREECRGDLRMVLRGERASELVRRLSRPLDLLGAAAESTRRKARERVAALVGKRRVPFWKVVAAFPREAIPFDDSLSRAMATAVPDPAVSRCVVDVRALPAPPPPEGLPLICSVDLLIGARDVEAWARGEYEVVMGDIHDTALVWGWALQFHPDRPEVELEMIQTLGGLPRPLPVVTMLASRRTGLLPSEFPGPVVELGGVSARPSAWRLPFDDLEVVSDGTTALLWSKALRSEVCLQNGELDSLVHTAFTLPRIRPPRIDLGDHTPRVSLDEVIVQREQWRLPERHAEALLACKDDKARLRAAARTWEELKLPELVFAKLPNERKPVLVDPSSPLLLRSFLNLLEHRGGATLSEMFPTPSQLWLRSGGGRHTAELRCTFVRGGNGA